MLVGSTELTSATSVADIRLKDARTWPSGSATAYTNDTRPPGLVVSAWLAPSENPEIILHVRSDEPLDDSLVVEYSYGGSFGNVPMNAQEGDTLFEGSLVVDVADSLFDRQGLFEVSATDTAGNTSQFFAPWWIDPVGIEAVGAPASAGCSPSGP
jgi:hypothetical protein